MLLFKLLLSFERTERLKLQLVAVIVYRGLTSERYGAKLMLALQHSMFGQPCSYYNFLSFILWRMSLAPLENG